MDKIFIVSILVTFLGTASTTDFQDVLTDIDGKCKESVLVSTPCSVEKGEAETDCTKLTAYKTCLGGACDQDNDLDKFIATMETTCQSGTHTDTPYVNALANIDGKCKESVLVSTPCNSEKDAVETPLTTSDLTTACTKLPDYKSCLLTKCHQTSDLMSSIDTMEEKCSSGFMKISVSMLTLFLAAIVNFL